MAPGWLISRSSCRPVTDCPPFETTFNQPTSAAARKAWHEANSYHAFEIAVEQRVPCTMAMRAVPTEETLVSFPSVGTWLAWVVRTS